jgi:hypothetical protein
MQNVSFFSGAWLPIRVSKNAFRKQGSLKWKRMLQAVHEFGKLVTDLKMIWFYLLFIARVNAKLGITSDTRNASL